MDRAKQTCSSEKEILAAAKKLFAQNTYNGVSMSTIAAAAGVSKANLYHHFQSKDALYLSVLREACHNESTASLTKVWMDRCEFRDQLKRYILQHLASMDENPESARLVLRAVLDSGHAKGKQLAEEVFCHNFKDVIARLRESLEHSGLRTDVSPAFLLFLIDAANVFFFQSREVMKHMPEVSFAEHTETYGELIADMLLHGLAPRSVEATQ